MAERVKWWIQVIYRMTETLGLPIAFWILSVGVSLNSIILFAMGAGEGVMAAVNLSISVLTLIIAQAASVGTSRHDLSMDAKLDIIISKLPGDNKAVGIEKKDADEIQTVKSEVEEKAKHDEP